MIYFLPHV